MEEEAVNFSDITEVTDAQTEKSAPKINLKAAKEAARVVEAEAVTVSEETETIDEIFKE